MMKNLNSSAPSNKSPLGSIILTILVFAFACNKSLAADFEARLGWQKWLQHYEGFVDSDDINSAVDLGTVDFSGDLGFDEQNANVFYLVLEHPLGVVPNIRFQHTQLDIEEKSTLGRDISYEDIIFSADQAIFSDLDLSHNDISVYWQPIQGNLSIGLGFTIRIVDGSFLIATEDRSRFVKQTIADAAPLPYFQLQYKFPRNNLTLGAEFHGAAYNGDRFVDANLRAAYRTSFGLGIEAGYRTIQLKADELDIEDEDDADDSIDIDIEISGLYFGLFYSF